MLPLKSHVKTLRHPVTSFVFHGSSFIILPDRQRDDGFKVMIHIENNIIHIFPHKMIGQAFKDPVIFCLDMDCAALFAI